MRFLMADLRCAREIGLRSALGATPVKLAGLVLRQGLLLTAAGVVVGIVAAAAGATRAIASLLFGIEPSIRSPTSASGRHC